MATGSCLSSFGNKNKIKKKKKRMTVLNTMSYSSVGVSFVGQVVWNTEPVRFFFSLDILFFFSHAHVGLVKKK